LVIKIKISIKYSNRDKWEEIFMKKDIPITLFYGIEDFTKLFNQLVEDKMRSIEENIKNERNNRIDKCYSSISEETDINE
jgi:hypothetical protein